MSTQRALRLDVSAREEGPSRVGAPEGERDRCGAIEVQSHPPALVGFADVLGGAGAGAFEERKCHSGSADLEREAVVLCRQHLWTRGTDASKVRHDEAVVRNCIQA